MHDSADPNGPSHQRFQAALLEYSRTPGKYQVAFRHPPLLFASIREILQLAAGREADAAPATIQEQEDLRQAARFFTRTALLYPGADHYALFGLERAADGAELKDRYRLLMRLIHPDFAGEGYTSWPADAAVRVNLAYEVLSSAVHRREYDARLAAASKMPSPVAKVQHRRIKPPVRPAGSGMSRLRFQKLVVACGVTGLALVLIVLFMGTTDGVHLVQRRTQPVDLGVAAIQEPMLATANAIAPGPAVERSPAITPAVKVPAPEATKAAPPPPAPIASFARIEPTPPAPSPPPTAIKIRAEPPPPAVAPTPTIPPPQAPTPQIQAPPAPAPVQIAAPVQAPPPRPTAPPSPPQPSLAAGVTLAEAQPLLSLLLQHLESGRGEHLIDMLDREARAKPGAQALSHQYDGLVDGMRPVRLSHVEFKAEPADGRLLVTGNIRLQVGEQTIGSVGKKLMLRAEFASRQGTIVMTGLSGISAN
jgi:DnaJ-like protein